MNLRLDWCSHRDAKYAVEHWHYARRMPKFKQVYIGVWELNSFIGCVIFGLSVTPHLGDRFGLSSIECAELTRIALKEHVSPVSRIGALAVKMINKQSPGLRLLVSYADPKQGHNGAIYQAMNWLYCGQSAKIRQYYWRGQWRNDTPMFRAFKRDKEIKSQTSYRDLPPKYKYLYPLDNEMRKQIEPLRKPYPKSVGSIAGDAMGFQSIEGGSIPTPTLQNFTGKEATIEPCPDMIIGLKE